MIGSYYFFRNKVEEIFYKNIFRKIFFKIDPEKIHDRMVLLGLFLGRFLIFKKITSIFFNYENKILYQEICNIKFKNPVGLAAGFDKNAQLIDIIPEVGFGFMEIGSITGQPCLGNEKPRLWRLLNSKGLVVNYGLKNDGCEIISKKLIERKKAKIPIGISIAKTNSKTTIEKESGIADYVKAFEVLKGIGDYVTINISCPNAFGGCPFTNLEYLEDLLLEINKRKSNIPIFLKIPADISERDIDGMIELSKKYGVAGFVCTNLNKNREHKEILDKNIPDKGGISGKILNKDSNKIISYVRSKVNDDFIIIGCGGIFSAKDAYEKILSGANLLQLITGMIYEGPQLISDINRGIVNLLKRDGFSSIKEAVGKKNEK